MNNENKILKKRFYEFIQNLTMDKYSVQKDKIVHSLSVYNL